VPGAGGGGRGPGRPSKLYRRPSHDIAVSLPARHYGLAADLLAAAVTEAAGADPPVVAAGVRVTRIDLDSTATATSTATSIAI
jgi:predicted ArsR family transcriptional regulator